MSSWKQWYDKARKKGYKAYKDIHKGLIILDPQGEIAYQIPVADEDYNRFTPQEILGAYYRDYGDQEPDVLGQLSDVDTTFVGDQDKPYNDEDLKNLSLEDVLSQRKGPFLSDTIPQAITQAIRHKVQRWQQSARRHGTKAPAESGRKLGPEQLKGNRYNPQQYAYGEVVNVLDFETVGTDTQKGSVLSYAVIKVAHNLDTGNWDIVDKRTRYYYPTDEDYLLTDEHGVPAYDPSIGVSGLTPENIAARRKAQLAHYRKHFTEKERISLINYLGDAPVVGHNIGQFDWPKLLGLHVPAGQQIPSRFLPKGGLIDTLHLAEGTRGTGSGLNTNEMLFTLAYGMTPEQYGFTAHDALEDVQITLMVFAAMAKSQSRMGIVSRYLLHHPGLSTQFRDSMIKGFTEIRGMSKEQTDLLDAFEDAIVDKTEGETIRDYIESPLVNFDKPQVPREQALSGLGIDSSGLLPEIQELKDALSRLTANINDLSKQGSMSSATVRDAAKLSTVEERKKYIHDVLGVTGDVDTEDWNSDRTAAGYILKRANALYKARHEGRLEDTPPVGWADPRAQADLWNTRRRPTGDYKTVQAASDASVFWYRRASNDSDWRIADLAQLKDKPVWQSYIDGPRDGKRSSLASGMGNWSKGVGGIAAAASFASVAIKELGERAKETARAYDDWFNKTQAADKTVFQAGAYFIPGPFKEAGSRLFSAYEQQRTAEHIGRSKWLHFAGDLMTGKPIQAFFGLAGDTYNQRAQGIASQINLWSGYAELLLAPIRILSSAFRHLSGISLRLSKSFLGIIDSFSSLGLPLTNLTGVTYSGLQRSYVADKMIGAPSGTINKAYNAFANEQMGLYSLGQVNQDRLIAAAMTGTFGSVYAYGGDTQEQFANTANILARRMKSADPREKQRLMMLAGKIDSSLPTVLQQMDNLGISDFRDIQSGKWLSGRGIRQWTAADNEKGLSANQQRARYARASMEWGGLMTSFTETRNQIAVRIWESFGKDVMSGLNNAFHRIALGDWRGALKDIKKTASAFWKAITEEIFGEEKSIGDVGNIVLRKIKDLFMGIIPIATEAIKAYINIMSVGFQKLAPIILDAIDTIASGLSYTSFSIEGDLEHGFHPVIKTLKHSTKAEDIAGAKGFSGSVTKDPLGQAIMNWYDKQLRGEKWGSVADTPHGRKAMQEDIARYKNMTTGQVLAAYLEEHPEIEDEGYKTAEGMVLHSKADILNYWAARQSYVDYNKTYDPREGRDVYGIQKLMGVARGGYLFDQEMYDNVQEILETLGSQAKEVVPSSIQSTLEALFNMNINLYNGTAEHPGSRVGSGQIITDADGRSSVRGSLNKLIDVTRTSVKMLQNGVQG